MNKEEIKTVEEKEETVKQIEEVEEVTTPKEEKAVEKAEEIAKLKEDKFGFAADMMGKSEQDLKNDTYRTYIKTFMNKIGKIFVGNSVSAEQIESAVPQMLRFNGAGVCLAPIYFDVVGTIRKKTGVLSTSFGVVAGYPTGVSTLKGLQADIKECVKNGASEIIAVFPTASVALEKAYSLKNDYVKLAKKNKKATFGIAVNPDISEEHLKKLLESLNQSAVKSVTLLAEGLDALALGRFVTTVANAKGNLTLNVFCALSTFDEVSYLIKRGADKIYTPYFENIGEELIQQFGVQM